MEKIDVTSQYEPYYSTISAAANCVKSGARGKLASNLSDYISALNAFSFSSWNDEAATATKTTLADIVNELKIKLTSIEGTFKSGEQAIVYLQTVLQMLKQNETNYNRLVDMWKEAKSRYDSEPDYIDEYSTRGNKKVKTGTRANPNKENLKNLMNDLEEQGEKIKKQIEKNIEEIENYIKLIDQCDNAALTDAAISIPTISSSVITVDTDALMAKYPIEDVTEATYDLKERLIGTGVGTGAAVISGAANIVDGVVNVAGVVAGAFGGLGALVTGGNVVEGFQAANFGAKVDLSGTIDNAYFESEYADASYLSEGVYNFIQTGTQVVILGKLAGLASSKLLGTAVAPGGTQVPSSSTALSTIPKATPEQIVHCATQMGQKSGTAAVMKLGNKAVYVASDGVNTQLYMNKTLIAEGTEAITNFLTNNPSLLNGI